MIGGDVNGSQYHPPSASNRSGGSVFVGSILLTSPTWWGVLYLQNSSKILLCVALEGNQDPAFSSVQFISVAQLCPTLCDPMDCSTPGLLVHYQCPEFTQTQVHGVGDAIQPSHPLSSPSPPTFNLS